MNEKSLKKSSKTLYIVCSCMIFFMFVGYLGIRNVKNTYSATWSCYYTNGGMRTWVSSKDETDASKGIACTKMGGSSPSTPTTLKEWCEAQGYYYTDKTACEDGTKKECTSINATSFGGGKCWKATNCWLSCTYKDKTTCEAANPGYSCEKSEVNCCFQKTTLDTYCKDNGAYPGKEACETETKKTCTGRPDLLPSKNCYSPDTTSIRKGACGDSEIDVGGYGFNTYTCMINGKNYTYSCTHNNGSQVGAGDGSWSTCKLSETGACYEVNNEYIWSSQNLDSHYEIVNKTRIECAGCKPGFIKKTSNGSCVSNTEDNPGGDNPGGDNPGGDNPGGDNPGGGTTTPSNPSSSSSNPSSSSTPSSSKPTSSSNIPSSSSNIVENPKTGTVAILIVWIIALGTLAYSFVYFRQLNKNKK